MRSFSGGKFTLDLFSSFGRIPSTSGFKSSERLPALTDSDAAMCMTSCTADMQLLKWEQKLYPTKSHCVRGYLCAKFPNYLNYTSFHCNWKQKPGQQLFMSILFLKNETRPLWNIQEKVKTHLLLFPGNTIYTNIIQNHF